MKTIELNDEQMKNLMVFLNRTQLAGTEVPAYLEIVKAINEQDEKVEDKKPKE